MVDSSSPVEGGRRARLAAERRASEGQAHPTPAPDAEVLDSRRSRRADNMSARDAQLWTDEPLAPAPAPRTRREQAQRTGRRTADAPVDAPTLLGTPQTGPFDAVPATRTGTASVTGALPTTGSVAAAGAVPPTGTVPVTRASLKADRAATGSLRTTTTGPSTTSGPSTTELDIVRGRRAARPETSRRRAEVALGRSMSNRRVWGGVLTVALVLLVPGASMLSKGSVNVTDSALTGNAELSPIENFPDSTLRALPDASETTAEATARAKAKAKATAEATAAAKKATESAKTKTRSKAKAKKPSSGSTGRITNSLSGLPWASGVYSRGQGAAGVKSFGDWRGADVDVAIDWSARANWNDVVNPAFIFATWKNTPYEKVIGVAPIPEDGSATLAGCAAGSYNDKWRQFGQNFQDAGMADETVIRLGWEFNGDWFVWAAHDPKQFAECWRQIVGTVEQVAPGLLWDWNVNRGKSSGLADAREAYPGDDYVDIIGVDSYDMWPGVTDEASWAKQYSGPYGLKFWSDFAREHGKKVSVPEWGVYPGPASSGSNGGDNAFYITKMQGFFRSQGSHLAYESYFNESAPYVASSIFGPTQNPAAAAKYKSLFGG